MATQVLGLGQATPPSQLGVPLIGLFWRRQVLPPSVLRTIVALTAMALALTDTLVLGRGQATRMREVPLDWRRQVLPPSVLRRIVPLHPTATQVLGLRQATPSSSLVVALGWRRQVLPPSVLRKIVPPSPTATQVLG